MNKTWMVVTVAAEPTVMPSNIPSARDHRVTGSVGFKFQTPSGPMLVVSGFVPLRAGGLAPHAAWTLGLEFNF